MLNPPLGDFAVCGQCRGLRSSSRPRDEVPGYELARWNVFGICVAKLYLKPSVHFTLFIQASPPDGLHKPHARRSFRGDVLGSLVARRAESSQVGEFVLPTEAFVLDVSNVKSNLAVRFRVDFAR